MRQAIQVKYLCPTNTKGIRFKASCAAGTITVNRAHELNPGQDAERAAKALLKQLGWGKHSKTMHGGVLPNGDYVFVLTELK